jgi:hypothetical protein
MKHRLARIGNDSVISVPRCENSPRLESLRRALLADDWRLADYYDWIVKTLPGPTACEKLALMHEQRLKGAP